MSRVSLKKYFEKLLSERDKAIQIELKAAKEAVKIAEENAQRWREQANEWRDTMNDKDRLLMQRAEFITYRSTTDKSIEDLKTALDKNAGQWGRNTKIYWLGNSSNRSSRFCNSN